MKQRTEEWFKIRENKLTASDFASACGENKFCSTEELWLRKTKQIAKPKINADMQRGIDFEQKGIDVLEIQKNIITKEIGFVEHPDYDWLGCSPDGITAESVIEVKAPRFINPNLTERPNYYEHQIQGQMEICNKDMCFLVLISATNFKIFEVKRNKDFWNNMLPRLEEFWHCVKNNINPKEFKNV